MSSAARPSALQRATLPIVCAPMAGGPSGPRLAAAVTRAGGIGFLAAGYLTADAVREQVRAVREQTRSPFGVNVLAPAGAVADPAAAGAYAERLAPLAARAGVALGTARHDDDDLEAKVQVLVDERVPVASFTFSPPSLEHVDALHRAGSEVWVTVTSREEARLATERGADALVVQGVEAGGHRGTFADDDRQSDATLLVALQLIGELTRAPLIASGGLMTGRALAAVLAAGASAGQLGSAYLLCDEAGTPPVQRAALATSTPTVLTRAYSGRLARGIVNGWHEEHGAAAPRAYPEVHHLTSALRAHGREVGDPDLVNLWAGQAHELAHAGSAEEVTLRIAAEARDALARSAARFAATAPPAPLD